MVSPTVGESSCSLEILGQSSTTTLWTFGRTENQLQSKVVLVLLLVLQRPTTPWRYPNPSKIHNLIEGSWEISAFTRRPLVSWNWLTTFDCHLTLLEPMKEGYWDKLVVLGYSKSVPLSKANKAQDFNWGRSPYRFGEKLRNIIAVKGCRFRTVGQIKVGTIPAWIWKIRLWLLIVKKSEDESG